MDFEEVQVTTEETIKTLKLIGWLLLVSAIITMLGEFL